MAANSRLRLANDCKMPANFVVRIKYVHAFAANSLLHLLFKSTTATDSCLRITDAR